MTAKQQRALRPTDDTAPSVVKKQSYRDWREAQAEYATTDKGGLPSGLVFDVAQTGRDFELSRQEYWQAKGRLSRAIKRAKGLSKPQLDALELKLSDVASLITPWGAIATGVDKVMEASKKRKEYDTKMGAFEAAIKTAGDEVRDDLEALKGTGATYWTKLAEHHKAIAKRDDARVESRQRAGLLGQSVADPSETRSPVLAEVRMPFLVADAWHALAAIGPSALRQLTKVLAARGVVERASTRDESWRSNPVSDIGWIRRAWQMADSWKEVLTKEEVEEWVAMNKVWEETLTKFNV
jgi:hypothetical protein